MYRLPLRSFFPIMAVMLLAVLTAACSPQQTGEKPSGTPESPANPSPGTAASPSPGSSDGAPESSADGAASGNRTVYPFTWVDATGTEVTLNAEPVRIVSMAPSETEMLYALGAGDRVVAVDNFSDYPEEAKTKPKIGDLNVNYEAILAAKPDLVVAAVINREAAEKLRALGLAVHVSDPQTLDEVAEHAEMLGKILNLPDAARQTADRIREGKRRVREAVQGAERKKVYLEFSPGFTVGEGTYLHEMVELAGGENVAAGTTGWFPVEEEAVIAANPDVIIVAESDAGMPDIAADILRRPGWEKIAAVQAGNIFAVDTNLVSRPGPRLVEGLQRIARAIHPERNG